LKTTSVSASHASDIALNLINFIASDEVRLERFLALSGMTLGDLKSGAASPEFHGFLLDYALQDEILVKDFAIQGNLKPETLQLARLALPGASYDF
jgi:Protein of unknown function (DUF3572)